MDINIWGAWLGMLTGVLLGAVQGLFFHKEEWMGGYASWKRRMTRLGHIAFFGIAFINLGFVSTVTAMELDAEQLIWASRLLIVGQVGMPLVCYLSAFYKPARNLFFIPVLSVTGAVINVLLVL